MNLVSIVLACILIGAVFFNLYLQNVIARLKFAARISDDASVADLERRISRCVDIAFNPPSELDTRVQKEIDRLHSPSEDG